MASLRSRADHRQAASRRLELLTAELAGIRPGSASEEPAPAPVDEPWLAGHTRIRPLRVVPEAIADRLPAQESERTPIPVVPLPGRHAARRGAGPPALMPDSLRPRFALGSAQLVVVAVVVAIGLAVTAWWVVRGDPERLEVPGPVPVSGPMSDSTSGPAASPLAAGLAPSSAGSPIGTSAPAGAAGGASIGASIGASSGAATVTVDVTGKVRKRGIVVLEAGARVVDAIDAAGGARRGVDLSSLNLARVLVDGEQIVVGGPASVPAGTGGVSAASPAAVPVNLNTATQPELESLPEVGPVTAQAILAWRSEHGGFTAVEELLEVDGIGDATLAKIAPHVTV